VVGPGCLGTGPNHEYDVERPPRSEFNDGSSFRWVPPVSGLAGGPHSQRLKCSFVHTLEVRCPFKGSVPGRLLGLSPPFLRESKVVQRRSILAVLSRSRLIDLTRSFEIPGLARKSKDQIVQGLVGDGYADGAASLDC